jgi:hypothetical protein
MNTASRIGLFFALATPLCFAPLAAQGVGAPPVKSEALKSEARKNEAMKQAAEAERKAEAKVAPAAPDLIKPIATAQGSGGNTWFPVTIMDLGTFFGHGEAVGTFRFKNPGDQAVEWRNLAGSCQCAHAAIRVGERNYVLTSKPNPNVLMRVTRTPGQPDQMERVQQIAIGPGEEGEVEVHLDMNNITGPKHATLDIHSTDATLPHTKLSFHANGAQLFVVSPTEFNLNKMTWNESREFTFNVVSPLQSDWNILRMDDAGKAFDVRWEKSQQGGRTSWLITGKYGPVDSEMQGGGVLKFHTDVQGGASFTARVIAFVQGPLDVTPGGFLSLGMIRKGQSLTKEIVFQPNDGVDLAATSLLFEKMTVNEEFVTATARKDGEKLVVDLVISDRSPTGLLKGELVVQLNHPVVKEKRIMFNGFVR